MKKKELKKLLKQALKLNQVNQQKTPGSPCMSTWLETYREIITNHNYKSQTIKNHTTAIRHIESMFGSQQIASIKPFEITTKLKQFSPHNSVRILGELKDVYNEAIANGITEQNPALHVKPQKAPGLRKRLTLETFNEMLLIAEGSNQKWIKAMLLLAIATGQRRSDLAKMKFTDVQDDYLRIEQHKKACKAIGARLAIPLRLKLQAIDMTLGEVIECCKSIAKPGENLLRQQNGSSIEASSLSARFKETFDKTENSNQYKQFESPSLHEVRSLSARTYLSEGMQPEVLQTLLGHKHAEMTSLYLNDRGLTESTWKTVQV